MKTDFYEAIKWIFSGTGIFLIGLAINYKRNRRIMATPNNSSIKIAAKDPFNISKLSARKIESEIDKLPPYTKDDFVSNYKGIRIRWNVVYYTSQKNGEKLRIMCRCRFGYFWSDYPWVVFEIELAKYPIFKTIKRGTHFSIIGKIVSYSSGEFEIDLERFD